MKKIFCIMLFVILITGCNKVSKEIPKYEVVKYDIVQKNESTVEATVIIKNISKVDLNMTNIILVVNNETEKEITRENKNIKTTIKPSKEEKFVFELKANKNDIKSRMITIYKEKKDGKQIYEEYNKNRSYPSIEQYIDSTDIIYEGEKCFVEASIVNSGDSSLELGVITLSVYNLDTKETEQYKTEVNKSLDKNESIKIKFKVNRNLESNDTIMLNNAGK